MALIADRGDIAHKKADAVVNTIFDSMIEALLANSRIEIRGFGSFVNRKYGSYTGRNPRTGEPIQVASKRLSFFKPGKELRELLNKKP